MVRRQRRVAHPQRRRGWALRHQVQASGRVRHVRLAWGRRCKSAYLGWRDIVLASGTTAAGPARRATACSGRTRRGKGRVDLEGVVVNVPPTFLILARRPADRPPARPPTYGISMK
jgi:hypothetical protein